MTELLTIFCFISFFGECQSVEYIPFEDLVHDSMPEECVKVRYDGDGIWYHTTNRNDTVFAYNSSQENVDFYGDTLDFDIKTIDFRKEDPIILWGERHYKRLKNGWLIGTNKGEWGGCLFWISEDLKEYKYLGYANVNKIFEWNGKIYILEGVSHLNVNEGYMIEFKEKFVLDTLMRFPESPYNATISDDSTLYILTDYTLYSIDQSGSKNLLFSFNWWPSISRDITYCNNALYIGMHHGIAKFDLNEKEMSWFRVKKE